MTVKPLMSREKGRGSRSGFTLPCERDVPALDPQSLSLFEGDLGAGWGMARGGG